MADTDRSLRTSDPVVLRALAHPLRVELIEQLDEHGELTASELAARTDQTVANCSFHLRQLEKAGYVERAEPRGREKPWRAAHDSRQLTPDAHDPASVAVAATVASLVVQREAAALVDALTRPGDDPEFVESTTINTIRFWATAEELAEVATVVETIASRFAGRWSDPSLRPTGSRPARIFAAVYPERRADDGTD